MSTPEEIFRTRIKQAREDADLSLSQAAIRIGCAKAHLWELESGKADNPGLKLLRGMARTYAVPVSYLIGDTNIPMRPKRAEMLPGELDAFMSLSPDDRKAIERIVDKATQAWRDEIGHT